jgi:membrane fusion protein, multidrug efflux system
MIRNRPVLILAVCASVGFVSPCWPQDNQFAAVTAKPVSRTINLPGEITPYMSVALHAKVSGYVDRILVDRGSVVRKGDLLAELSAPETAAQIAQAESRAQAAEAEHLQAEAQLAAAQSTADRLQTAARTPGAVAGNEVVQAQQQVEAAKALLASRRQSGNAAEATVRALKDIQAYLKIAAPFDGVVTDRLVHPGALVGPGADTVLLVLQQVSHLRLVVAVPEDAVAGIVRGAELTFTVPASPERTYKGTVARIARVLDQKSRTMPVELDVMNRDGSLAPGMYATVKWPVRRTRPALYVPKTSVVTTTERTFVVRNVNGKAQWVDVRKLAADGDLVEVVGDLKPGDLVVRRATDELRNGAVLNIRPN